MISHTQTNSQTQRIAYTRTPAKLNLFLELIAKRADGYHEIDTVMVAIDWCDDLELKRTAAAGVQLSLEWLPSRSVVARRLGVEPLSERGRALLEIPVDERNLVYRALKRFGEIFDYKGGFACALRKRIPAGAGMGGASSDAAAALLAAASLCGVPTTDEVLCQLAGELGSDVPFFLGQRSQSEGKSAENAGGFCAAHGTGRGERIEPLRLAAPLDLVVVFPGRMLSTPRVYAQAKISEHPESARKMIESMAFGRGNELMRQIHNQLSVAAASIEPKVLETLHTMKHSGLDGCQMTGSGSACFGFASSARHAKRVEATLAAELEPGAIVRACRTMRVPPAIILR